MNTAQKYSNSRKDELMVNLKAAALVCGVVVTCLGGGLGVACLNSAKVSSADFVEECDTVHGSENEVSQTTAVSADDEKSTTNKKVTTSMATSAKSSKSEKSGTNESSKTEISTAVTTAESTAASAAKVTVPAPVHAPVTKEEVTEPVTETQTESATEYVTTTADALAAPIPPSTEALTQAPNSGDIASTTAPTGSSGTSDVSSIGAGNLYITDEEYIILCNAVANEAGSDWISVYDKARVVEVIMNRVGSELFPNSIYGVLAQPYQFEGAYNYINLGTYSGYVTDSVIEAVNLYFSNPESFSEGFFYFYGDGYQNYFS